MIVVDTSLIAYYLIPGEHTSAAVDVRVEDSDWIAPQLWVSELRNVLSVYVRRGTIGFELALEYIAEAEAMMSGRSFPVDSAGVLAVASGTGCTAYDAEFITLARTAGVPLVTTDRGVLDAVPDVAIHPDVFAG